MALINKATGKPIKKVWVIDAKGKRQLKKLYNYDGTIIFQSEIKVRYKIYDEHYIDRGYNHSYSCKIEAELLTPMGVTVDIIIATKPDSRDTEIHEYDITLSDSITSNSVEWFSGWGGTGGQFNGFGPDSITIYAGGFSPKTINLNRYWGNAPSSMSLWKDETVTIES